MLASAQIRGGVAFDARSPFPPFAHPPRPCSHGPAPWRPAGLASRPRDGVCPPAFLPSPALQLQDHQGAVCQLLLRRWPERPTRVPAAWFGRGRRRVRRAVLVRKILRPVQGAIMWGGGGRGGGVHPHSRRNLDLALAPLGPRAHTRTPSPTPRRWHTSHPRACASVLTLHNPHAVTRPTFSPGPHNSALFGFYSAASRAFRF